jgi:signal transduction histidine kinase
LLVLNDCHCSIPVLRPRFAAVADGVYRWFYVPRQLGHTSDGQPTLWYGLLVDIDDRKNVEEALRRTETQLARAAQTATVGELAASIAHEVNQPLSAVVANANACLRWLSAEPPNFWCAEYARQLEGESPFDNLMEVKS